MFCPNCGKKVQDDDNFCKYCGKDLRDNPTQHPAETPQDSEVENRVAFEPVLEPIEDNEFSANEVVGESSVEGFEEVEENFDDDEIVVYEIKKHFMAMFWPCVFSPIFITYFWKFYVIIPSFWGFVIALLFLAPIIHPVLRYFSDRIVITSANLYITRGFVNVEEIRIPLNKIHLVRVRRSYLGRLAGYGHLVVERENSDKEITYRYIQEPDEVQFILCNPEAYIKECLK